MGVVPKKLIIFPREREYNKSFVDDNCSFMGSTPQSNKTKGETICRS